MAKHCFFITGQPRSGTSLLSEIIGHYPETITIQQPLPLLLYHLKTVYNKQQNTSNYYPITPLFSERFDEVSWLQFLAEYQIDVESLAQIAKEGQTYSGVYEPGFLTSLELTQRSSFREVLAEFPSSAIKEVFAEEWIPYFIKENMPTLLIIRDSRDMMASLLKGEQMGDLRGFYFHLLLWRKSVAFALEYQNSPFFKYIQLEHLLVDLPASLYDLGVFLGDDKFPELLRQGVLDKSKWKGNSNVFINGSSKILKTSSRKEYLTEGQCLFVETICYAEMKTLGYKMEVIGEQIPDNIVLINDPIPFYKEGFPSEWLWNENSRKQEMKRFQLLQSEKVKKVDILNNFIFLSSYKQLKIDVR